MSNADDPAPQNNPVFPNLSATGTTQTGLNLVMELKDPVQIRNLAMLVAARKDEIDKALEKIGTVHFARFLPLVAPPKAFLLVITVYDGSFEKYILDFTKELGPIFDEILKFMVDPPTLPVQQNPKEFLAFIHWYNSAESGVWSAYPDHTAMEIKACLANCNP